MEIYGSSATYNLENVLRQNILGSDYYRQTCASLNNWSDIVDEIYENVDHVEPWMSGNARGASSTFCLLHRLFTLKLTAKQIKDMLDHRDSPYIRAVSPYWYLSSRVLLGAPVFGAGLLSEPSSTHCLSPTCAETCCVVFKFETNVLIHRSVSCTFATWRIPRRCGAGVLLMSRTRR